MFHYLVLCFASLYIIKHWDSPNPPIYDLLSPLVTIFICCDFTSGYGISLTTIMLCCSLVFEAIADATMHNWKLEGSILFFSIGHIIKQVVAVSVNDMELLSFIIISTLIFITMILILVIGHLVFFITVRDVWTSYKAITCYIMIIGFTAVVSSIARTTIDKGYLCYIISDIFIGYELAVRKLYPRRLRVLLIPILYWLGQYLTIRHLVLLN